MNIYIIKSFSFRLLETEIKNITENSTNIIRYNYDETTIEDILSECSYYSLFSEQKYVIVTNFKFSKEMNSLNKYLTDPNSMTTLILVTSSIDKRSTIYKKVKENGKIIEITELKNNELINVLNVYCKSIGINIDYNALQNLIEENLSNYDLIQNEIDKLSMVTNKITLKEVLKYGAILLKDETFKLCDAITNKKYLEIDTYLSDFISTKNEVVPIVSLLASQYRLIYAVKCMNGSNETIASTLNVHPYRVKLAIEKARLYSEDEVLKHLVNLCDLDYRLKTSNIDSYALFKYYLINS